MKDVAGSSFLWRRSSIREPRVGMQLQIASYTPDVSLETTANSGRRIAVHKGGFYVNVYRCRQLLFHMVTFVRY